MAKNKAAGTRELRRLSRTELLELLVEMSNELEKVRGERDELAKKLEDREIKIEKAGSIAEASFALAGVLESAQKAADLYMENLKRRYPMPEGELQETPESAKTETPEAAPAAAEPAVAPSEAEEPVDTEQPDTTPETAETPQAGIGTEQPEEGKPADSSLKLEIPTHDRLTKEADFYD